MELPCGDVRRALHVCCGETEPPLLVGCGWRRRADSGASMVARRVGAQPGAVIAGEVRTDVPCDCDVGVGVAPQGIADWHRHGLQDTRAVVADGECPKTQKSWRRPIFPKGCPLSIFGAGEL